MTSIGEQLACLYGAERADALQRRLLDGIGRWRALVRASARGLSHRDAMLITYGDQFRAPGEAPLRTLADFARRHLSGLVSAIHLLPFYPYSSDDGFSVIDYRAVDPTLGTWEDAQRKPPRFLQEGVKSIVRQETGLTIISGERSENFYNGRTYCRVAKPEPLAS